MIRIFCLGFVVSIVGAALCLAANDPLEFEGHQGESIKAIQFSPDGMALFSLGNDDRVRQWSCETFKNITVIDVGVNKHEMYIPPKAPGRIVVWGHSVVEVYDLASSKRIIQVWKAQNLGCSVSHDGKRAAIGKKDGGLAIVSLENEREPSRSLDASTNVLHFCFLPVKDQIVGLNRDGTVVLWDAINGKMVRSSETFLFSERKDRKSPVGDDIVSEESPLILNQSAFSVNGDLFAFGGRARTRRAEAYVFDISSFQHRSTAQLFEKGCITGMSFSADSRILALGGTVVESNADGSRSANSETRISLFDGATGRFRRSFTVYRGGQLQCLSFSASGKQLACGSDDGRICVWNLDEKN